MKRLLGVTTLLLVATAAGRAQTSTGSILGVVRDQSGGVLPGVTITVTEVDTNQSRTSVSNDQGYYEAGFLPPGNYSVKAGLAGFKNVVLKGVILQVGQKAKVDVTLAVGDIAEQVTVEGVAPLLQASEATVGQVINRRSVQELPLNGRQFMSLALLVPGVSNVVGGGNQARGTAPIAQFSASGSREDANVFTLDGAVNTDSEFHHFVISPNPDEIQEFKVNTNSYSAELGYNSGAQISIVTRSGSNRLHGSLYEYHRNSALDAKNFFDRPAPAPITPFKRNQFGATGGGPIFKDRTFFFVSYEGLRIRQAQTSTVTVPNATLRGGDFRGRRPIYDPLSLKADPTSPTGFVREAFLNNIIPSTRISPQAIALLKYSDLPNLAPTAAQAAVNVASYLDARSLQQDHNQWAIRGDHRFNAKDSIFARYTQTIEDQFRPGAFTSVSTNYRPRGRIFALGYTRVFSGTSVNDLTLSATRLRVSRVSGNAYGPPLQTQAGLKGFENSDPVVYGIPSQGAAGAGITLAGDIDPQVYRNNYIQAADQFSRTLGKHTLKWGGSFINMQLNDRTDRFGNGAFSFDGRWTNDATGRITASGDAFADMLLGALQVSDKTSGNFQVYLRRKAYGLYVQDDWRLTSNLTVNLGLRYDYSNPWIEKYDRFGGIYAPNFTGLPEPVFIQASKDGWPRGIVDPDKNNFAPRLGLAYRPGGSNRTAIRAGYGVFYNKDIGNTIVDFVRNYPFTVRERRITGSVTVANPPYTLADPFPSGQPLSQTRGIFGQRTPSTPDATIQNWNLTVQRLFLKDLAVEVAYVGSAGRKLPFGFSKNVPPAGPGDIQSRRPWPSLAAFQYAAPFSNSFYHAFQAKVEKRYSGGLTLLSSLTISKSIDDGMSIRTTSGSDLKSEYNVVGSNRGRSGFDQRQRFVTSLLYDLPVGLGKGRLDSGWVGRMLGGWQVGGIGTFSSGFPFTIRSGFDRANNGVAGLQSPDPVAGVDYQLPADQRDPARWLNIAGLQIQQQYTLGLLGRNTAQGPGLQVIDLLLSKATVLAEGHKIDFRAEFFNLLNHPNFDLPGASFAGTSTFGVIQSAGASRQIQFGLRYEF